MPRFRKIILSRISRLARSTGGRRLIAWSITHFDAILPINRLYETDAVLAFYHPQPAYPLHILIVPKQPISNLLSLQKEHAPLLLEFFQTAQNLVRKFNLDEHGYRLVLNGGKYQDIPQLHFHLISDSNLLKDRNNDENDH